MATKMRRELLGSRRIVCSPMPPAPGCHRGPVPGLAAVVGALDHLPEPATGQGGVDPVGIGGRAFHVVNLPAPEVGAADVPALALTVRRQQERAFPRPHQYPYPAHDVLLSEPV